ncbi:MAG: BlaI/MecI/CopY family transcriptional regulator [Planctomycetes bacterium]|nr:BlaI/MecI/CopY family transcriptional regulator [Planctomycetota bacterium]
MTSSPQPVTDAEFAVLEFLWEAKAATKRDLIAALYPRGAESDVATVQKLLERLEGKGHVKRDRGAVAHVFAPVTSRNEFVGEQLTNVAQKLSGGGLASLVMHLVESKRLTKRERDKLRSLLDSQP